MGRSSLGCRTDGKAGCQAVGMNGSEISMSVTNIFFYGLTWKLHNWTMAVWLVILGVLLEGRQLLMLMLNEIRQDCATYVSSWALDPFYLVWFYTMAMFISLSCGAIVDLPLYRVYTLIARVSRRHCTRREIAQLDNTLMPGSDYAS